jgi:hypothetical protein
MNGRRDGPWVFGLFQYKVIGWFLFPFSEKKKRKKKGIIIIILKLINKFEPVGIILAEWAVET